MNTLPKPEPLKLERGDFRVMNVRHVYWRGERVGHCYIHRVPPFSNGQNRYSFIPNATGDQLGLKPSYGAPLKQVLLDALPEKP